MNITLRHLEADDIPTLAQIIDETPFYQNYPVRGHAIAKSLQQRIEQNEHHLVHVATLDDQPIGFAWYLPHGAFGRSHYLRLLAVSPDHQHKGIGRQLLSHGESHFLHPHGLCLLVTADNTAARAFYEHLNYNHIGTLPNYVREGRDECIYIKTNKTQDNEKKAKSELI